MISKNSINIPQELKDEIWDFCRMNDITNVDTFTINLIKQGLTIEKYGSSPIPPKIIEKEIIKEIEVIKEVEVPIEKIVQVPVEKIIEKIIEKTVEVPVEKIVEKIITDDSQVQEMASKIRNLELELENTKNNNLKEIGDKEKDLNNKITLLEKDLEIERLKTSKSELGKLYQEIENLKALLELEQNRNKYKKEVNTSKKDLYGE
jgi:hypothetical protein